DAGADRVARAGAGEADSMILLPRAVRVYFATQPTNLRKSFDGLVNEIRHSLGHDPLGGHVFVFLNRRKNQVKLIVWTRGGFTIVHKRLLCGAPHKSRYAEPVVMRRLPDEAAVEGARRSPPRHNDVRTSCARSA